MPTAVLRDYDHVPFELRGIGEDIESRRQSTMSLVR